LVLVLVLVLVLELVLELVAVVAVAVVVVHPFSPLPFVYQQHQFFLLSCCFQLRWLIRFQQRLITTKTL